MSRETPAYMNPSWRTNYLHRKRTWLTGTSGRRLRLTAEFLSGERRLFYWGEKSCPISNSEIFAEFMKESDAAQEPVPSSSARNRIQDQTFSSLRRFRRIWITPDD